MAKFRSQADQARQHITWITNYYDRLYDETEAIKKAKKAGNPMSPGTFIELRNGKMDLPTSITSKI